MAKPKYIRRTLRALIFGFIAFAFLYTAVVSYEHRHANGYTPLLQSSPATGHYSNPLPMVVVGLCFTLFTVLQVAKIIKVARSRRQLDSWLELETRPYPQPAPAPQYWSQRQRTGLSPAPPVHRTAAQNAALNANGATAQNAARNMHGNAH
jgi:hypothetical protein